jgi:hypothetical protein
MESWKRKHHIFENTLCLQTWAINIYDAKFGPKKGIEGVVEGGGCSFIGTLPPGCTKHIWQENGPKKFHPYGHEYNKLFFLPPLH